jgi:phosphate transport system substrate-binding protein
MKEYGYEPTEVPLASDALAIFVHKDNPITGLSLEELDAIFCQDQLRGFLYPIDSWGLAGLDNEWFEAPVHIYGQNGKSGGSSFFREEICKGGPLSHELTDAPGSASVILKLETDQQGIGFSSIGYTASYVKPIQIASVKGGRYVEPSFESISQGSYPLRRNLYLYIARPPKVSPAPPAAELVRFALSQQGQQLAIDFGYFPLSRTEVTRVMSKWSTSIKSAKVERPGRPIVE